MESTHSLICRAANRVSVQMEYLVGSTEPDHTANLAEESVQVTRDVLDSIDPAFLALWTDQLCETFARHSTEFTTGKWHAMVGRNCDRFSKAGLRAKTIEIVGTVFSDWNREPQSYRLLTDALDRLDEHIQKQSQEFSENLITGARTSEEISYPAIYSLLHNSLAVIYVGISEASRKNDAENLDAACVASFGIALFRHCVDGLCLRSDPSIPNSA